MWKLPAATAVQSASKATVLGDGWDWVGGTVPLWEWIGEGATTFSF
ncbi:MAG TPA: hypothetical protein VD926_10035 [Acidimicrobiales bacterium]|nr:hypothetical protein [Acidimicrobiales bacterium]